MVPNLARVYSDEGISIYRHDGPHIQKLKRFVVSTPETRAILNHPEICGYKFRKGMLAAITRTMQHFPAPEILEGLDDTRSNVLVFLRGGLNFPISDALGEAFGFEKQTTSYMTSQRDKDKFGRWFIKDAQYQKFVFENHATIFCGDIVATGSTISHGLECLVQNARNSGKTIDNLVFFTIGCHKIEKLLEDAYDSFREHFKTFQHVAVIYLEGKFHLADSKTDVEIKIQGTDLMKRHALLAPEYLLSQFVDIAPCLERCVVYDGGSRSFNVRAACTEVMHYWLQVRRMALHGRTLKDYLAERFPDEWLATDRAREELEAIYPGIPEEQAAAILAARAARWADPELTENGDATALERLAMKRVLELELPPVRLEK